jgi:DNA-binding transcriptional LysR family regulator
VGIEVRQLRYAVATADASSFASAAIKLGVKQSTLSKRISSLENLLGIRLFERTTRGAIPSDLGRALLDVARRILGDIDAFETSAHALSYGRAGQLVIGFSASLCVGNLKCAISDYLDRFPDVHFAGVEAGSERLCSGLQSRTIDIAIHSGDLSGTELVKRALWSERLMLALPQDHPLVDAAQIYWNDLCREAFVIPNLGGGPTISEIISRRLSAHGHTANITLQEATQENILGLVSLGKSVTLVTESALGITRPALVFRQIEEPNGSARLDYSAYWHKENDNLALKAFFSLIDLRYPAPD